MNKIILIGNLTRDPECSTTQNGVSVCKMALAVNRNFTNGNGERECDFFNIVAWRGLADNCGKFLSKGKKIGLSGSLQMRQYEDKNGNNRTVYEVMADEIEFLSPKDDERQQAPQQAKNPPKQASYDDGDLPF